ncbi:hypothetical protein RG27_15190 [Escherichia coli]|uniref:hypothetical protein n=1 Tax=Escherichia coli TaxID=562 RepID=UPI00092DD3EA|nr:hypothetical protein [Escherichia coli]APJ72919.1 hypothetical protein RG27_15190 [Escherichia coli]HBB8706384.1 hypothetical protein [Escherichia coli]HDX7380570.1 hypothetical protein [Escherichia coli]
MQQKFEEVLISLTDGGRDLKREEWDNIYLFTLLFAFGESKWSHKGTSVAKTGNVADWLLTSGSIDQDLVRKVYSYYTKRYLESGRVNHRFHVLFPNDYARSDTKSRMIELMENPKPDEKQMLSLCLKVLHCLRNNLFHGEKWKFHFTDQYENFKAANGLLQMLLFQTKGHLW